MLFLQLHLPMLDGCITMMGACHLLQGRRESKGAETGGANKAEAIQLTHNRLFGFLLGATASGAGMYYYVIDEYRVSNQLLTEDIYVRHSHLPSLRMFADEITIYGGRLGKRAIANENRLSNPRSNG